jgi:hypothetical protein
MRPGGRVSLTMDAEELQLEREKLDLEREKLKLQKRQGVYSVIQIIVGGVLIGCIGLYFTWQKMADDRKRETTKATLDAAALLAGKDPKTRKYILDVLQEARNSGEEAAHALMMRQATNDAIAAQDAARNEEKKRVDLERKIADSTSKENEALKRELTAAKTRESDARKQAQAALDKVDALAQISPKPKRNNAPQVTPTPSNAPQVVPRLSNALQVTPRPSNAFQVTPRQSGAPPTSLKRQLGETMKEWIIRRVKMGKNPSEAEIEEAMRLG